MGLTFSILDMSLLQQTFTATKGCICMLIKHLLNEVCGGRETPKRAGEWVLSFPPMFEVSLQAQINS